MICKNANYKTCIHAYCVVRYCDYQLKFLYTKLTGTDALSATCPEIQVGVWSEWTKLQSANCFFNTHNCIIAIQMNVLRKYMFSAPAFPNDFSRINQFIMNLWQPLVEEMSHLFSTYSQFGCKYRYPVSKSVVFSELTIYTVIIMQS